MFCMNSRRASRPWSRPRSGCQGKMGAMARATLTTGLALILSVARGFLLLPPSSSPRHCISPAAFPAAVSTSTLAANIRIQHPCLRNTFLGCAKSLRPVDASRWSKAQTLSPTCCPGGVAYGNLATSTRLRTEMLLMPGLGRKLAFVGLANAAAFATVGGGLLAGGLHAISGPDHLAALLPRIMGQRWRNSMRIGATWGLGHGFSATVIGLTAFFFKGRLGIGRNERMVSMMGMWTEGLVGISLIAIGLLGLKESLLDHEETPSYETKSAGSAVVEGGGGLTVASKGSGKAIFLNGVLHGFSWDGAPSLAPALAFSSWASVLWFLLAYCSGTMVAMSATTTLIGEGSLKVGQALDQPDVPRKLSIVSSFVAIGIGVAWFVKAVLM